MAKKKNKTLIIAFAAVAAIYFLTRQQPQFQQAPPRPAPTDPNPSNAWAMWAMSLVQIFGNVSSLWQPGGPLYRNQFTDEQAQWIGEGLLNAGIDPSTWVNP